jgi:hypothetical protein
MWDLIIAPGQFAPATSDKSQTSVFNLKTTAIQPNKAVPIGMRNASLFQSQTS